MQCPPTPAPGRNFINPKGFVSAAEITLDYPSGFSFDGNLGEISSVIVIKAAAPISELNFEEVDGSTGMMLVDVFTTDSSEIFYSKRLEISNSLFSLFIIFSKK